MRLKWRGGGLRILMLVFFEGVRVLGGDWVCWGLMVFYGGRGLRGGLMEGVSCLGRI